MKRTKLLLTLLALCTTTSIWAGEIKIPTTDGNPFDLTAGTVTSSRTSEHFTNNVVENMYDGDLLEYTIENKEDLDVCNFYVEASNGGGTATLDISLKSQDGTDVTNTTVVRGGGINLAIGFSNNG